jgi:hypothetical protein
MHSPLWCPFGIEKHKTIFFSIFPAFSYGGRPHRGQKCPFVALKKQVLPPDGHTTLLQWVRALLSKLLCLWSRFPYPGLQGRLVWALRTCLKVLKTGSKLSLGFQGAAMHFTKGSCRAASAQRSLCIISYPGCLLYPLEYVSTVFALLVGLHPGSRLLCLYCL